MSIYARWWAVLGLACALTVLLAAVLTALISKAMWGYFVARPELHSRVVSAREVVSVTPLDQIQEVDGAWPIRPSGERYAGPGWYEREKAAYPREYDYYLLDRRPLRALEVRGVLTTAVPSLTPDELPNLAAMLRPVFAAEQTGYDRLLDRAPPGVPLSGTLYELVGARGERLMLLAVRGGEVSNDHYPYFELLYEDRGTGGLILVAKRRFYFDVAGLEGFSFRRVFFALSLLGLLVVIPGVSTALLCRRFSARGAVRRGHCPRCQYDLIGDFAAGCPECGWGRGEKLPAKLELRR